MEFVKYSCGCVGLPPSDHPDGVLIFRICDSDGYDSPYLVTRRKMDKPYEPLTHAEQLNIEVELSRQLLQGEQLQDIRGALGLSMIERRLRLLEKEGGCKCAENN